MDNKLFVVLIGAPGSGKGTQARILCENMNLHHLSTGDMIRFEISANSELGKTLQKTMFDNGFIPDEMALLLIENKLKSLSGDKGFLLDGFPRTMVQAEKFEKMLKRLNQNIDNVIELDVDDEVITTRITGRYSCKNCGVGYHDKYLLPKIEGVCDNCGGKEFIRREDDELSNISSRLENYRTLTYPVLSFYKEKGLLSSVNGVGSAKEIYLRIAKIFK